MTWYFPRLGAYVPKLVGEAIYPIDKTNLDVLRILHFFSLAVITVWFVPRAWPALKSPVFWPAIVCGQHSLEIFCLGVFLSFAGHFVFTEVSNRLLMQVAGQRQRHRHHGGAPPRWFRGISAWSGGGRGRVRRPPCRAMPGAAHDGAGWRLRWRWWCWPRRPLAEPRPEHPAQCLVAQHLVERDLSAAAHGRRHRRRASSTCWCWAPARRVLPVPNGAKVSYPARLQQALAQALPGVTVKVSTDVKSRRTAADMVKTLAADLTAAKPALVVWQTGTVDAMQAVDPDEFSETLERGIGMAQAAGADVVLINAQYSPRTESMIALGTYAEDMRWVALQHEVPLFDRFSIMKLWADLGTFDLTTATNKLDMAEHVHDCIGRLLSDLVVEAVKPAGPQANGRARRRE